MIGDALQTALGETRTAYANSHLRKLYTDFQVILSDVNILEKRTENVINVATAIISIEENKRAMKQNQDLSRLTYLAFIFIPMSFVCGFFSMTPDLSLLTSTIRVYFAIAVPLTIIALGVADWIHVKRCLFWTGDWIGRPFKTVIHAKKNA